jgi:hypothetical protein
MNFEIDFPSDEEIEEQKKIVMKKAFLVCEARRLGIRTVFYQCRTTAFISLLIYFLLMFLCSTIDTDFVNGGVVAIAIFPLTYFSFYFLSLLSEQQNEVVELKQSMCCSFMYLIHLRMFYASFVAVLLNILLFVICFKDFSDMWSIFAAGTTSMLFLALASLVIYEKTGSSKLSAVLIAGWVVGCLVLMKWGTPIYHLIIDVIPLAVHIVVALISFGMFVGFIGKVEKRNAYGF